MNGQPAAREASGGARLPWDRLRWGAALLAAAAVPVISSSSIVLAWTLLALVAASLLWVACRDRTWALRGLSLGLAAAAVLVTALLARNLVQVGVVATGTALALLAPPTRRRLGMRALGFAALGAAALLARDGPLAPGVVLAAGGGIAILSLHAFWAQRERHPEVGSWDVAVMGSLSLGLGALSLVYTGQAAHIRWMASFAGAALLLAEAMALPLLAALTLPPPLPALSKRRATLVEAIAHFAAGMALLNILFLGLSVVSSWSLRLIFAVLFAWQVLVIGMEYRTLRHAQRRRARQQQEVAKRPRLRDPITVIVPACNEADVLPPSLAHNLAVDHPLTFLLVPAAKSTDRTVAVARRLAAQNPRRVKVVLGDLGSKAEELNVAWRHVKTEFVLLLDADETIDADGLQRALATLKAHPGLGVVQGRKVSRTPHDGFLSGLIAAERRYSTWMDHVMHAESLGSGHFGGSAALLRREVPPAIGGWTDRTLTEDIEFTLRLHLDGRWGIAYDPDMVVRESDPQTFVDLLKQRTRWARGWIQCMRLYLPSVVRKRRKLGLKRAFGLALLMLVSVSALWTVFVPATLLMRMAGVSPLLPLVIALPMTLLLLPARLLSYGYAAYLDPVIPLKPAPSSGARLALQAYLWILLGWLVQLHALYLELASLPSEWVVTSKRVAAAPA